jgi:hypothetical protein
VVPASTQPVGREPSTGLCQSRWNNELDLRCIKPPSAWRCCAPDSPMIGKELWTHPLVYILIRLLMAQAAVCAR